MLRLHQKPPKLLEMTKTDSFDTMNGAVCVCSVVQSFLTLCNPMNYSSPGSSIHGIFQARMMEWIAISSYRGSSWPRDRTGPLVSLALEGRFFTTELPRKPYEWCCLYLKKEKILGTNIFTCKYTLKAVELLPCHAKLERQCRINNQNNMYVFFYMGGTILSLFALRFFAQDNVFFCMSVWESLFNDLYSPLGLPWWVHGKESTCQSRR